MARPSHRGHPSAAPVPARPTRFALVVLVALIAAACGGNEPAPRPSVAPEGAGAFPVTVEASNGTVTIPARPTRIVSMSATATEILFAIGAGEQVIAVDSTSNFPEDVPTTDLSAFEPNAEAIAGYEPDLVVLSDDINEIVDSLGALQMPTILQNAAEGIEDTYAQIEQLGIATGHTTEAEKLVGEMRAELEQLADSVPPPAQPLTYYHELDPTFYTATSETFVGQIYALAGLENIADAAGDETEYPQLSAEFIVEADPDLIFLADTKCCDIDAAAVASRPGWAEVAAVRNDGVVELDDDVASRWGPRVVDLLKVVVDRVRALEPVAA